MTDYIFETGGELIVLEIIRKSIEQEENHGSRIAGYYADNNDGKKEDEQK